MSEDARKRFWCSFFLGDAVVLVHSRVFSVAMRMTMMILIDRKKKKVLTFVSQTVFVKKEKSCKTPTYVCGTFSILH